MVYDINLKGEIMEEIKKDTYSYDIDGKLYINLTNKCSNNCDFCVRHKPYYEGYYLWLKKEPTFDDVIKSLPDLKKYKEVVFCGYGEPTYKVDEIVALGEYFKKCGLTTRLNTNGQGNEINKRDITKELSKVIDIMSISLNQSDKKKYDEICHSVYGQKAFDAILDFAKKCVQNKIDTYLSIVKVDGVDVALCEKVAKSVGAKLKAREYIEID